MYIFLVDTTATYEKMRAFFFSTVFQPHSHFFSNYRFPSHAHVVYENFELQPTANDRLCSKYFEENCFYKAGDKTRLLDDTVPTIFIDLSSY